LDKKSFIFWNHSRLFLGLLDDLQLLIYVGLGLPTDGISTAARNEKREDRVREMHRKREEGNEQWKSQ